MTQYEQMAHQLPLPIETWPAPPEAPNQMVQLSMLSDTPFPRALFDLIARVLLHNFLK